MISFHDRFFLVDSKNCILSVEELTDHQKAWVEQTFMMDQLLTEQDLQHYTQQKQFYVVQCNVINPPSKSDGGGTFKEHTALTIPYTFKLTSVFSSSSSNGTISIPTECKLKVLHYTYSAVQSCMETPYLNTVKHIITHGESRDDRTGTGTVSIFGNQIRFDISEFVPLLTTKFVPWKSCIHELLWFLRGSTNSKELEALKVNIWKDNTTREFLDSRGLTHLPEGDIGAGYGFQWRHFGAEYENCHSSYDDKGFDQISDVIRLLREDPTSRRILFSAWNPLFLKKMALPPCHVMCQFYVSFKDNQKYLSCQMYQRSQDVFLGAPFNIFSYASLTYLLAKMCNMKPKELIISSGDTHIYKDHIEQMKEQLKRVPLTPPRLTVSDDVLHKSIDEITINDFELDGYFYHPRLYGKMSV